MIGDGSIHLQARSVMALAVLLMACVVVGVGSNAGIPRPTGQSAAGDPVKALVDRLDLERYKAVVKGLAQFGDRREGTDRNRAALDWIEAQLIRDGCTNVERVTYADRPSRPRRRRAMFGRLGEAVPEALSFPRPPTPIR